ncbi:hypothetical protein PSMK_02590 [Phycisphaera mikurensis NBRC 102666]|uniref:Uncharacterized protein n=1 Tax=Phycisphaera mikurensis (strain NBRC 102666 / KCTC 22515 / FYK2301M01) TaxID=1142394 RepID=I0IAY0_PHYMF|nr:hypothetical protein PSMK_02590 [Phycisphaera mikurensis NBRC 102666]
MPSRGRGGPAGSGRAGFKDGFAALGHGVPRAGGSCSRRRPVGV